MTLSDQNKFSGKCAFNLKRANCYLPGTAGTYT